MSEQSLAFGVDPRRSEKFSLRQSRYHALSLDVSRLAGEAKKRGERLRLLDIGVSVGVSMRYIEVQPHADNIDYYGADLVAHDLYKNEKWKKIYVGDFMEGYPEIEDEAFDVVICEQVLEHLPVIETAIKTLERLLKPGGTLIVGVPIFVDGLDMARKYIVPVIDKVTKNPKVRGHVQAFSLRTFKKHLRRNTALDLQESRGFRIISGGILKPLENKEWWWRFNRSLGAKVPALCIEVQVRAKKPERRPS